MTHENMYNLTLSQQAETAQRMLNDVQLQKTGAIALQNGRLEVTSDHYQTAQAEMEAAFADRPQSQAESQAAGVESSAEAELAIAETLRSIVERSGITVNTYMSGDIIQGRPLGYCTLRSDKISQQEANNLSRNQTKTLPLVALNAQGVAEIVTFSSISNSSLLGRIPGRQGEGDLTAVTYETTDSVNRNLIRDLGYPERIKYDGKIKRYPLGFESHGGALSTPGASFSYNLFMGDEDAAALRALITERPEAVHQLNETIMTQAFGADPDAFSRLGPQYDAWREADGGQMKLAIRDALDAPPEESQIIEY